MEVEIKLLIQFERKEEKTIIIEYFHQIQNRFHSNDFAQTLLKALREEITEVLRAPAIGIK